MKAREFKIVDCGHGGLMMDAALVHWRALVTFRFGPHHKDDLCPCAFGVKKLDSEPWVKDGHELVNKKIAHLTWESAQTIDGFAVSVVGLFDRLNETMIAFTEQVATILGLKILAT